MCPTGWFIETQEAPDYLAEHLGSGARAGRAQGAHSRRELERAAMSSPDASRTATVVVNVPGGGMVSRVQDALGDDEVVVGLDDDRAADAEIMLVLSREREALERSAVPGVRWLHAFSTGVDGFPLDVDRRPGVHLLPRRERGADRRVRARVDARVRQAVPRAPGSASAPERWGFASLDVLAGKTVGLVGVGAIGTEVARRALAFDMRRRRVPAPVGRARALRDRVVRHARASCSASPTTS